MQVEPCPTTLLSPRRWDPCIIVLSVRRVCSELGVPVSRIQGTGIVPVPLFAIIGRGIEGLAFVTDVGCGRRGIEFVDTGRGIEGRARPV